MCMYLFIYCPYNESPLDPTLSGLQHFKNISSLVFCRFGMTYRYVIDHIIYIFWVNYPFILPCCVRAAHYNVSQSLMTLWQITMSHIIRSNVNVGLCGNDLDDCKNHHGKLWQQSVSSLHVFSSAHLLTLCSMVMLDVIHYSASNVTQPTHSPCTNRLIHHNAHKTGKHFLML